MWIENQIDKIVKENKKKWLLENASSIKITDLKNLKIEFNNSPQADWVVGNCSYGHAYQLKQYAGIDATSTINSVITHGINIFNTQIAEIECSHLIDIIITSSKHYKERIEGVTSFKAIPIGPYIAYAHEYCAQEELLAERRKNGRTLLVFPEHGIEGLDIRYDMEAFCEEIDQVAKDFDTIMVCLYFRDVYVGMDKFYKKRGYKVVCAGYRNDKYFLSRLRMIFQLSDAVIGNAYTTGLAYALYFDKPVYVFRQEVGIDNESGNNGTQLERITDVEQEFYELTSDKSFGNLEKQKEWGKYYFGLDEVKSKEELAALLNGLVRR